MSSRASLIYGRSANDTAVADEGSRRTDYRTARISGALALIAVVVAVVLIDAVSAEYAADAIIVTSILGAAAALLGVEIVDFIRRPK